MNLIEFYLQLMAVRDIPDETREYVEKELEEEKAKKGMTHGTND